MEYRDRLILEHIGRYTISIRSIIENLFFDGGPAGNTLNRLAERELIQRIRNSLEGGYSYYQLAPKGAKALGLPQNRAGRKDSALAPNLAALWFSCKPAVRRKRLNDGELNMLFGAPEGGNVIYVAQDDDDDQTAVFRLFVPSEGTAVKTEYVRALHKSACDAMNNPKLVPWIERGTYRFMVLVHSEVRKEDLERFIRRKEFPRIRLQIDITPTPSTLPLFIPKGGEDE